MTLNITADHFNQLQEPWEHGGGKHDLAEVGREASLEEVMLKIHCYSFYRLVSPPTFSIDPRLPDYVDCVCLYTAVFFCCIFRTYHHCSQTMDHGARGATVNS